MLTEHDGRTLRCRRLGHEVTFAYCRREAGGCLCARILDCWWQTFDVRAFLEQTAPESLAEMLAREPAGKLASIVDMIEAVRGRGNGPPDRAGA